MIELKLAAETLHKSRGEAGETSLLFRFDQEEEEWEKEREQGRERVQQEEQQQDEEEDEEGDEEEESGQARHGASTSRAPQKQSVSCADSQVTSATTTSKAMRKKRKKKGHAARIVPMRKKDDCKTKCAALYSTNFNVGTCDLNRMMFRWQVNKSTVKKDVIAVPLSTVPSEHKGAAADKTCAFFNLVASSVAVMDLTITRVNIASCLTVHPPSLPADGGPCTAVLQLDMEDVCIECVNQESKQPKSKQPKTISSLCEIYGLKRKGGIVTNEDMALQALCHVTVDPDTNPPAQKKQKKP